VSPVAEYLLHSSIALLGVGLLAALLVFASRRWGLSPSHAALQLLGRLPLEGKRAVYVVRVGKRVLVLAGTDQSLTKVAELEPGELPDLPPRPGSFAAALRLASLASKPATSTPAQGAAPPEVEPSSDAHEHAQR
jgi:flagellar biogenesis protein FliO